MAKESNTGGANQLVHLAGVLSDSPESKRELERLSREIGTDRFPLKKRGEVEEPLQAGLSYLQVQAGALLMVSNLLGRLEGMLEHLDLEGGIRGALKSIQLDLAILEDTSFNGFATFARRDGGAKREVFSLPENFGGKLIREMDLQSLLARIMGAAEPNDLDVDAVRQAKLGVNELIGEIRARIDELVENFRKYSERYVTKGRGFGKMPSHNKGSWLTILLRDEFALEIQANLESDVIRVLNENVHAG
jgi:hypothetical protein